MAVEVHQPTFRRLDDAALAAWDGVPPSIVSDVMGGGACPDGLVRLAPGPGFVGQALTVRTAPLDVRAVHFALEMGWPGAVLVIDGGGRSDGAVAGEIFAYAAEAAGFRAIVADGPIRDAGPIRAVEGLAVYARSVTPAGPIANAGGVVNVPVQCGGVPVAPGDLVVGDDDGVAIVPLDRADAVLGPSRDKLAAETDIIRRVKAGETTRAIFGVDD